MNDNEWKYQIDKYYNENYQRIKSWAYKYAIKFGYNTYAEDILNDMYLWLLKNKRREIRIDKHILWYLSNMHFTNSETLQYNYNEYELFDNVDIIEDAEITDKYLNEYRKQKHINQLKEFYDNLNHLEKALYKLYYIQNINTIHKLAAHLNITNYYADKYIKQLKNKLDIWKQEKQLQ